MASTKLRNKLKLSHHLYNSGGIAAKRGDAVNECLNAKPREVHFLGELNFPFEFPYIYIFIASDISCVLGFSWCVMGFVFLADQLSATGL